MTEVVTLGETMAVVAATETGPFTTGATMRLGVAGAESNVAVGLCRLGHRAAWVGRLGDDSLGEMVLSALRAEGVDVSRVRRDAEQPTGLMLRERRIADRVRVTYYRRGLAGSLLGPEDVDDDLIGGARVLHVTGITPALSATARDAVLRAVATARAAGVTVSLDLNYRELLWSRATAAAQLRDLVAASDVVFAGPDEAAIVVGAQDHPSVARQLAELGPRQVVLKLAAEGAHALVDGHPLSAAAVPVSCVDPIGAGDAFVAGYLTGLLEDRAPQDRLRLATLCGAFAVSVRGDWEGLPRPADLALLDGRDVIR